jgi:F-type H+-transporting ATPase subunit b
MELFSKLGINPLLLIGQIINFLILFFLLKKILYKPILGILEKRRNYIEESMKKADKIAKQEKEAEKEREEKMRELRIKSQEIIDKAKKTGEDRKKEILKKAEVEASGIIEKSKKEAESEKERVMREVRSDAADLTTLAVSQVLKKGIDTKLQQKLIHDALSELDQLYKEKHESK